MSDQLDLVADIHLTLEHDEEGVNWDAFVEAASILEPDDICALLDELSDMEYLMSQIRKLPDMWEDMYGEPTGGKIREMLIACNSDRAANLRMVLGWGRSNGN